MNDLIAAEWLKLRTTRTLLGMVTAAVAVSLVALAGMVLGADHARDLEAAEGLRRAFAVTGAGAIFLLVLGIIMSAGEYRHSTASDSFLTTPRRHLVLAAKVLVGAAVGAGAGVLIGATCLALAAWLFRVKNARLALADADLWLTLGGVVAYTALFAVVGVAFGSLIRSQTVAITAALAWFGLIEHTVVNLVPPLGRWLPFAAGEAIVRAPLNGLLSPLAGLAVLTAYGAAIAIVGIRVAAYRDA